MPINFPHIDSFQHFDTIDSTNSEAQRFIQKHPGKNAIIIADAQTAGRGRLRREWHSPGGKGLWWSLVLGQPEWIPPNHELLSLYAGIVTGMVLSEWTAAPVKQKWPNDLYIGDKKICGILIERKWLGNLPGSAIIGIGINLLQSPEDFAPEMRETATSLIQQPLLKEINRPDMLAAMIDIFFKNWDLLKSPETLIQRWQSDALWLDEIVEIRNENQSFSGKFRGLNKSGYALIEAVAGVKIVVDGEFSLRKSG